MKLFRWSKGRADTGYWILPLMLSDKLMADAYLLKYPTGAYIPPHKDPAPDGFVHFRVNIVLPIPHTGGRFITDNPLANAEESPNLNIGIVKVFWFESSEVEHEVRRVYSGTRWVISFGWLKRKPPKLSDCRKTSGPCSSGSDSGDHYLSGHYKKQSETPETAQERQVSDQGTDKEER